MDRAHRNWITIDVAGRRIAGLLRPRHTAGLIIKMLLLTARISHFKEDLGIWPPLPETIACVTGDLLACNDNVNGAFNKKAQPKLAKIRTA